MLWSEEAKLFGVLHKHGLLSETHRRRFVVAARHSALSTPEWRFMQQDSFRSIFRPSELRALRSEVRRHLTSAQLVAETDSWKSFWEQSDDKDPGDYFWSWNQGIEAFAREFEENRTVHGRFVVAGEKLDRMVDE